MSCGPPSAHRGHRAPTSRRRRRKRRQRGGGEGPACQAQAQRSATTSATEQCVSHGRNQQQRSPPTTKWRRRLPPACTGCHAAASSLRWQAPKAPYSWALMEERKLRAKAAAEPTPEAPLRAARVPPHAATHAGARERRGVIKTQKMTDRRSNQPHGGPVAPARKLRRRHQTRPEEAQRKATTHSASIRRGKKPRSRRATPRRATARDSEESGPTRENLALDRNW